MRQGAGAQTGGVWPGTCLRSPRSRASQSPMPVIAAFAVRTFDILVVALIFTALT